MFLFKIFVVLFSIFVEPSIANQAGVTTRYWDCCKPSCSWGDKARVTQPVQTCSRLDVPYVFPKGVNDKSGCEGGPVFTCSSQRPFNVSSSLSYGFVAARLKNKSERDTCCACYELTFTTTSVKGKRMIVQVTNTGYDLNNNHFDIAIPGGGQGVFLGCSSQYKNYFGGQRYGGISKQSECYKLPKSQLSGCLWRFGWFRNADNPQVIFKKVVCPSILLNITKCRRIE
jgi:hypothetical protein